MSYKIQELLPGRDSQGGNDGTIRIDQADLPGALLPMLANQARDDATRHLTLSSIVDQLKQLTSRAQSVFALSDQNRPTGRLLRTF